MGFITDKLIIVYNKQCHTVTISSPISTKQFKEGMQMFVDDSSLMVSQVTNEDSPIQ